MLAFTTRPKPNEDMLRAQLAYFQKAGGGSTVILASMAAIKDTKDVTAYGVSKWGVVGLTKQAAIEGVDYGVRVNAIAPGVIKTAIFDSTPADKMQEFEAMQPGGRLGDPDEMGKSRLSYCLTRRLTSTQQ